MLARHRCYITALGVSAIFLCGAAPLRIGGQERYEGRDGTLPAESSSHESATRPKRLTTPERPKPDQQPHQDDPSADQVNLDLSRRSTLAAEKEAGQATIANGWAAKAYAFTVVQGLAAIFGVVFTAIAAFAAIAAAVYAKGAAEAAANSARADNEALDETRKAAADARKDAVEQADRFKEQMSTTMQIMQYIAQTSYAMKDSAKAMSKFADSAEKQMLITGRQVDIVEKQHSVSRLQYFATQRPRLIVREVQFTALQPTAS